MRKIQLVLAVLVFLVPTLAAASVLKVDVILGLLDAGVSDVSIQRYVQRNGFTFDLSADNLKALKQAGASDALIEFLQDRETAVTSEQAVPGEDPGYALEAPQAVDGVPYYASPYYSFGLYLGYPYYNDYYYPYYGSAYYYPYGYRSYYPYYGHHSYYGGGYHGSGSGVVSYWQRNQSGHHNSSGRSGSHSGRTSRPNGSGHSSSRGSSHGGHGGGHGHRR